MNSSSSDLGEKFIAERTVPLAECLEFFGIIRSLGRLWPRPALFTCVLRLSFVATAGMR